MIPDCDNPSIVGNREFQERAGQINDALHQANSRFLARKYRTIEYVEIPTDPADKSPYAQAYIVYGMKRPRQEWGLWIARGKIYHGGGPRAGIEGLIWEDPMKVSLALRVGAVAELPTLNMTLEVAAEPQPSESDEWLQEMADSLNQSKTLFAQMEADDQKESS